ncbi:MAG: efflux RND transporter periplasmic adaptor subunit [Lacipirellulaceae bacterium]
MAPADDATASRSAVRPTLEKAFPSIEPAVVARALDQLDDAAVRVIDRGEFYVQLLATVGELLGARQAECLSLRPGDKPVARWRPNDSPTDPAGAGRGVPTAALETRFARPCGEVATPLAETIQGLDCPACVITFHLESGAPTDALTEASAIVEAAAEVARRFELAGAARRLTDHASRLRQFDSVLLALAGARSRLHGARVAAYGVRDLLAADRASVLVRRRLRWRVLAVSGVRHPAARSAAVRAMQRLARAALSTRAAVSSCDGATRLLDPTDPPRPEVSHHEAPPVVVEAIRLYGDVQPTRRLVVWPCVARTAESPSKPQPDSCAFAILAEWFDADSRVEWEPRLRSLTPHLAASLLREWRRPRLFGAFSPAAAVGGLVALATIAAACALCLLTGDVRVSADGRLMPVERAAVYAPVDGVVEHLSVRHGDRVRAGQTLVRVRAHTLEVELSRAREAIAVSRQELKSIETAKLRALPEGGSEGFDPTTLATRAASLQEQLKHQSARLAILKAQERARTVVSPLDGVVTSWRPEDYLSQRPVRRGERLVEVASESGAWRVELEALDHQAGPIFDALAQGRGPLRVTFVMKSDPSKRWPGRLRRVGESTRLDNDGQPVVVLEIEPLDLPTEANRTGQSVSAKIDCGRASLAYVWLHESWEAVQRRWF